MSNPSLVGRGNPFGCEGYKQIAYEIARRLGHTPEVVALPVASGDSYFGIWKGFRELHERLGQRMPLMLACQPLGAAPLALTERHVATEPLEVAEPESLALSAREPRSGWHATHALRLDGRVVEVPEADLAEEIGRLGLLGLCVEPASALASAGLGLARRDGIVDPDAETVCVITSSGLNWTEHLDHAFGRPSVIESAEELFAAFSLEDEVAAHRGHRDATGPGAGERRPKGERNEVAEELVITGRIFAGRERGQFDGWIRVRDGRIETVGEAPPPPSAEESLVIDAGRRTVMPGLVDSHVHLAGFGRDSHDVPGEAFRVANDVFRIAGGLRDTLRGRHHDAARLWLSPPRHLRPP